jgi:hypothetical protein
LERSECGIAAGFAKALPEQVGGTSKAAGGEKLLNWSVLEWRIAGYRTLSHPRALLNVVSRERKRPVSAALQQVRAKSTGESGLAAP